MFEGKLFRVRERPAAAPFAKKEMYRLQVTRKNLKTSAHEIVYGFSMYCTMLFASERLLARDYSGSPVRLDHDGPMPAIYVPSAPHGLARARDGIID